MISSFITNRPFRQKIKIMTAIAGFVQKVTKGAGGIIAAIILILTDCTWVIKSIQRACVGIIGKEASQ